MKTRSSEEKRPQSQDGSNSPDCWCDHSAIHSHLERQETHLLGISKSQEVLTWIQILTAVIIIVISIGEFIFKFK